MIEVVNHFPFERDAEHLVEWLVWPARIFENTCYGDVVRAHPPVRRKAYPAFGRQISGL